MSSSKLVQDRETLTKDTSNPFSEDYHDLQFSPVDSGKSWCNWRNWCGSLKCNLGTCLLCNCGWCHYLFNRRFCKWLSFLFIATIIVIVIVDAIAMGNLSHEVAALQKLVEAYKNTVHVMGHSIKQIVMITTTVEPVKAMFILRSDQQNFDRSKFQEAAKTWLPRADPKLIRISAPDHGADEEPELPEGIPKESLIKHKCDYKEGDLNKKDACVEVGGLINVAQSDEQFDYVCVVNDDTLVRPKALQYELARLGGDPMTAYGVTGCISKQQEGFCGGGGYCFHKTALKKMVGDDPEKFRSEYLAYYDEVKWADITTSHFLKKNGVTLTKMDGLYPWFKNDIEPENLEETMKYNPVLTLNDLHHPMQEYFKVFDEVDPQTDSQGAETVGMMQEEEVVEMTMTGPGVKNPEDEDQPEDEKPKEEESTRNLRGQR